MAGGIGVPNIFWYGV